MTLRATLLAVWQQALVEDKLEIELEGESYRVVPTRKKRLRAVDFEFGGKRFTGIEQNPETKSRWAQMARQGQRIMQFSCQGRYVANVADGKLTRYPAWHGLRLEAE
jgi:hypothetical protein